jgi:hypothetical protein
MMGDGVLRVTVMQKIATVSKGTASVNGHISGYFLHAWFVCVGSEDGNINLAAPQIDGD